MNENHYQSIRMSLNVILLMLGAIIGFLINLSMK